MGFFIELLKDTFCIWFSFVPPSSQHSRKGILNKPKNKIPYSYYKSDFQKELESDDGENKP
jgi:hypothetical protein